MPKLTKEGFNKVKQEAPRRKRRTLKLAGAVRIPIGSGKGYLEIDPGCEEGNTQSPIWIKLCEGRDGGNRE